MKKIIVHMLLSVLSLNLIANVLQKDYQYIGYIPSDMLKQYVNALTYKNIYKLVSSDRKTHTIVLYKDKSKDNSKYKGVYVRITVGDKVSMIHELYE